MASRYDFLEAITAYVHAHEEYELDEIIPVSVFLTIALLIFSTRRTISLRRANREIRQLQGIIPICSVCHKIRDEAGFWQQMETYISDHTEAEFSHGICSDCAKDMYGEEYAKKPEEV